MIETIYNLWLTLIILKGSRELSSTQFPLYSAWPMLPRLLMLPWDHPTSDSRFQWTGQMKLSKVLGR